MLTHNSQSSSHSNTYSHSQLFSHSQSFSFLQSFSNCRDIHNQLHWNTVEIFTGNYSEILSKYSLWTNLKCSLTTHNHPVIQIHTVTHSYSVTHSHSVFHSHSVTVGIYTINFIETPSKYSLETILKFCRNIHSELIWNTVEIFTLN